jgi:hypothetical protein
MGVVESFPFQNARGGRALDANAAAPTTKAELTKPAATPGGRLQPIGLIVGK